VKPIDRVTAGTFLVASPLLRDPNFVRTVVLLCEHGSGGSWGLVVNRRTALTYGELLEDLPFPAAAAGPVYWGGPCETSRMQVLHQLRRFVESDLEVCPGVTLGLPPETLRTVLATPLSPGESLHAYLGHAGSGLRPGRGDADGRSSFRDHDGRPQGELAVPLFSGPDLSPSPRAAPFLVSQLVRARPAIRYPPAPSAFHTPLFTFLSPDPPWNFALPAVMPTLSFRQDWGAPRTTQAIEVHETVQEGGG
jgi:hypothetical protein